MRQIRSTRLLLMEKIRKSVDREAVANCLDTPRKTGVFMSATSFQSSTLWNVDFICYAMQRKICNIKMIPLNEYTMIHN